MLDFTELFFYVYDFCTGFDPWWKRQLVESGVIKRDRRCRMHLAEITTITRILDKDHGKSCKFTKDGLMALSW